MKQKKQLKYASRRVNGQYDLPVGRMMSDISQTFENEIQIVVSEPTAIRSLLFNSFYWAALMQHSLYGMIETDPVANADLKPSHVHRFFKRRYLDNGIRWIDSETGETEWIKEPTTTTLSNGEFVDYCEKIRAFNLAYFNNDIAADEANAYYATLEEPKQWKDLSDSQIKKIS